MHVCLATVKKKYILMHASLRQHDHNEVLACFFLFANYIFNKTGAANQQCHEYSEMLM